MVILWVGPALSGPSCIYLVSSHESVYTQLIHTNNPTPTFSVHLFHATKSPENKVGIYYSTLMKLKLFWLLIRGNLCNYSLHLFQLTIKMLLYPEFSYHQQHYY
jgi:hypothetical protein